MLQKPYWLVGLLLIGMAAVGGCESASPGPPPQPAEPGPGVVTIAVTRGGKVLVNAEEVAIDDLAARLDAIEGTTGFWYHREAPLDPQPHANALAVIKVLKQRQKPVTLYLDKYFTRPMKSK